MIEYTDNIDDIKEEMLSGYFVGWPNPPSQATHMQILKNSYRIWLAIDKETNKVAGFINAISDGVMAAYIPLLEVHPAYQKTGIGKTLTQKMLDSLSHLYMIDILCDEEVQEFYTKQGMQKAKGVMKRNYDRQSCD